MICEKIVRNSQKKQKNARFQLVADVRGMRRVWSGSRGAFAFPGSFGKRAGADTQPLGLFQSGKNTGDILLKLKKCKREVFASLFQKAAGFGAEPHQIPRSRRKTRKKSKAIFSGFLLPNLRLPILTEWKDFSDELSLCPHGRGFSFPDFTISLQLSS